MLGTTKRERCRLEIGLLSASLLFCSPSSSLLFFSFLSSLLFSSSSSLSYDGDLRLRSCASSCSSVAIRFSVADICDRTKFNSPYKQRKKNLLNPNSERIPFFCTFKLFRRFIIAVRSPLPIIAAPVPLGASKNSNELSSGSVLTIEEFSSSSASSSLGLGC